MAHIALMGELREHFVAMAQRWVHGAKSIILTSIVVVVVVVMDPLLNWE
jgi:hypothetical protein